MRMTSCRFSSDWKYWYLLTGQNIDPKNKEYEARYILRCWKDKEIIAICAVEVDLWL